MSTRKYYWLSGIGLVVLAQLLLAYGLANYPDVLDLPPLRLSLIVISQLVIGLTIGSQLRLTRDARRLYVVLLILFYCFLVFGLFGPLTPSIAGRGVNQFQITVRTEAFVSFVVLIGFAVMNVALVVRLVKV